MLKPIDPNAIIPHVLEDDRKSDVPTIFHIKPLRYRESLKLTSGITMKPEGEFKMDEDLGRRDQLFCEKVVKIENWAFPGEDARTITTEDEKLKVFDMLSAEDGTELMRAIQNLSKLMEGEVKN